MTLSEKQTPGFRRPSTRTRLWIAALLASVIAIGLALSAGQRAQSPSPDVVLDEPGVYQQPGIGTNAPLQGAELSHAAILRLDGQEFDTTEWFTRDERPVLVNFWFRSCPPCLREMPALESAFATYGNEVRFIGVNVQDPASAIEAFTAELNVTYEMVRDPNGEFVVANGIAAFPTTLFIDSNGRIVRQVAGELTAETLDQAIAQLLNTANP